MARQQRLRSRRSSGDWTVSTIVTFQSGTPFRITGNNNTFNNKRDGGIVLNGITQQDIQDKVGLYFNAAGQAYFLPPDWVAQVKADGTITSNNVPGTWGDIFYLYGPHQTYTDIGISKSVALPAGMRFKFQMEMLNAFNHPTFATEHDRAGLDRVRPRQPDGHVASHRVPGEH